MQTLTIKQHERVKQAESLIAQGYGNYEDIGKAMGISGGSVPEVMRHISAKSFAEYGRNKAARRKEAFMVRMRKIKKLIDSGMPATYAVRSMKMDMATYREFKGEL